MTHREAIKAQLANINLVDKTVIDWGSGSKPAMRYIQHNNCKFTTIDNAPGIPEDRHGYRHLDLDISTPQNIAEEFDVAFCLEVLEHVEWPDELIENIEFHLKPGGTLYLSAPFKYPIHADADYWRFTKNGLKLLLERHNFKVISIDETVDELGYFVKAIR